MLNKIIELLPSKSLKHKIKELNHQFTDSELLQIIYRYSPTLEEKILLLQEFSRTTSDNLANLARTYIEFEKEKIKQFKDNNGGFVYELHIQEINGADERYLCSSYNDCLKCIDLFYEHYTFANAELSQHKIIKRKIFSVGMEFEEDEYSKCSLDNQKRIISIDDYRESFDCELENECSECNQICRNRCDKLKLPCFVNYCGIVRYTDYDRNERYGVNLCYANGECDGICEELFVIPLHSEAISCQKYEEAIYEHQHIEPALVEVVSIENLDDTLRKNYIEYVEYLKLKKL